MARTARAVLPSTAVGTAKLTVQPCIGVWGMALARNLLENYHIPICILNGAVGGTRIDQHQANPADHYAAGSRYSIYANLITRVAAAKLTHGIRGALWHQGEADLSNWGGTWTGITNTISRTSWTCRRPGNRTCPT